MPKYCTNSTKATINIFSPQQKVQVDAPVNIEILEVSIENYSHDMKQPINKEYSRSINNVTLNPSGQTYNNGAPVNPIRACPLPQISGKRLLSQFDDYYADNTGNCIYTVSLDGGIIINGKFFKSDDGKYTVACGDDCPEGYIKCECSTYPGYCCISCSEIRNGIASATAVLRGING